MGTVTIEHHWTQEVEIYSVKLRVKIKSHRLLFTIVKEI